MFGHRPVTALVAGAGPVGLFAALSLAQRGQSVRLIDRGVRTNFESYALALHPLSLSLLEGIGLVDEALALGLRVPRVMMEGFDGNPWSVELSASSSRFPFLLILPQGRFEGLLVRALQKEGVEVEWNRSLAGFDQSGDRLHCQIDHLGDQAMGYAVSGMSRMKVGRSRIEASYILGTDGIWSTVRRELGIGWKRTARERAFELYEFPVRESREILARVIRKDHGLMSIWPLPGNRIRMTFEVPVGSDGEIGVEDLRARCLEHEIAMDMPTELSWSSRMEFVPGMAESMGRDRCWLAGDSAHRTLPQGVQSMNGGLVEAALVASRISDAADAHLQAAAFEDYAASRLDEWEFMLGVGAAEVEQDRRGSIPATGRLHQQLMKSWRGGAPGKVAV
ncbi:hypothetical protein GC173_05720 [bacterium]|nr:hypothetical protein [bacterium]